MAAETTNVASIVKSWVVGKQLPIHYFVQFFSKAIDLAQEMNYDDYPSIKTVYLTLNDYREVTLPTDYVDWTKIGCQNGGVIQALSVNNNLSRVRQQDSDGNEVLFGSQLSDEQVRDIYASNVFFHNSVNQYGEHLGKIYGNRMSNDFDSFKIISERSVIQLHPSFKSGTIILLEYLSDNSSGSTASVHKYGEESVRRYLDWEYAQWRNKNQSEIDLKKKAYYNARRIFRARILSVSKEDLIEAMRRRTSLTIRS